MENLTDEQKKKIEAQIRLFQSEEQSGKDLPVGDNGTRRKTRVIFNQIPGSVGLSYSANKSNLRKRIELKRGGENV